MARKKAPKNASRPPGPGQAPTGRGPRRGGQPGTWQSSSGTNTPPFQPFRGANRGMMAEKKRHRRWPSLTYAPGHTLADEARNTAQKRRGALGPDAKLRHKPVTFVCAGFMNPLDDLMLQQKPPSPPAEAPKHESVTMTATVPEPGQVPEPHEKSGLKPEPEPRQDEMMAELEVDVSLEAKGTDIEEAPLEPPTTADNARKEEGNEKAPGDARPVILSPPTAPTAPEVLAATAPADPPQPEEPLFTLDISGDKDLRPNKKHQDVPVVIPDPDDDAGHETDSSVEVILFKGRNPALQNKAPVLRPSRTPQNRGQDATDSLQLHDVHIELSKVEQTLQASRQPAGESMTGKIGQAPITETSASRTQPPAHQEGPEESVVDDVFAKLLDMTQSDDDRAILADYMANMDEEDEDEDMDAHPGLGSHAFHQLRDIGGTDSDAVPEDEDDEDSEENAMDARLARLLAKQEALGLGSDDIMLFDGTGPVDDDDEEGWTLAPKTTPRRKKKGSSKTARLMQKKGQFPSASTMADAFDDLDLMDWHRPALNNYRSSQAPYCSDSELNEAMEATFQRDRLKKAERKKQREALRAQGLLGKKANPEDPRVLYPGGMSRDELLYELEQFLLGTDEQYVVPFFTLTHALPCRETGNQTGGSSRTYRISLPPLDKSARRCIHQAAQSLKIKSQSAGKGTSRYPVLYRTKATAPYDERTFSSATRYLRANYYPRVDVDEEVVQKYKALNRKDPTAKRGHNAISYREGEVVGQHASELASHNKGRQLLEKMGWTQGTALGTTENKGIMNPIMHRVKKTKAGLGES